MSMVWPESVCWKNRNNGSEGKNASFVRNPRIFIGDNQLKTCEEFKYLGSLISNTARIDKEVQSQIQKAKAAFSKLYQQIWSRCTMSIKLRWVYTEQWLSLFSLKTVKHYTSLITTSKKWRVASTGFYIQYVTRDGKILFTTLNIIWHSESK